MELIKQTVYLPVKENAEYVLRLNSETEKIKASFKKLVNSQEGYFFTPEQLNEYIQSVIKQTLETAAKKVCFTEDSQIPIFEKCNIDKESITTTFEQTFNQFKV